MRRLQTAGVLSSLTKITLSCVILYILYVRVMLISSYSLDLEGGEFAFVHFIQVLLAGHKLYANLDAYPYFCSLYMPVYTGTVYFFSKLCGLRSPDQIHSIYQIGRTVSWVAVVLNLIVLDRFVALYTDRPLKRIIGITLFLLLLTGHVFSVRVDSFQLLFLTVFLYSVFYFLFYQRQVVWLIVAVFFGVLAVFSKQDGVILITFILVLFWIYDRTRIAFYTLSIFVAAICFFLVLGRWIFGPFFLDDTILYNFQIVTDVRHSYNVIFVAISLIRLSPLIISSLCLLYQEKKNKRVKGPRFFIGIITVTSLVTGHVTMLRAGAHVNYANSTLVFLVISFTMITWTDIPPMVMKLKPFLYLLMAIYILMLFNMDHSYFRFRNEIIEDKKEYLSLMEDKQKVVDITKNDTIFLVNVKYVILFNDKPFIGGYDMHMNRTMEAFGVDPFNTKLVFLSTAGYDSLFENGRVKYIIAEDDEISKRILYSYYKKFSLFAKAGRFDIYRFTPASSYHQ